jgi:hypothetical protein
VEQRHKRIIGLIVFLGILITSGCVKQPGTPSLTNENSTFLVRLNEVDLGKSYTINAYSRYLSSGGGGSSSETREIDSTELEDNVNEIKNLKVAGSFEIENRSCYYGVDQDPNYFVDYFVCFADNKIVNYVKNQGPEYSRWNALGYEFDIGRSTLINSTNDLRECKLDSDCTLSSFGVCDPSGKCTPIRGNCDPGCRTSINVKYDFIWSFVPLVEDQCITDKCAKQQEYFKASCVNNICEPKIVK